VAGPRGPVLWPCGGVAQSAAARRALESGGNPGDPRSLARHMLHHLNFSTPRRILNFIVIAMAKMTSIAIAMLATMTALFTSNKLKEQQLNNSPQWHPALLTSARATPPPFRPP
jgi:hypothetical protein